MDFKDPTSEGRKERKRKETERRHKAKEKKREG